MASIREGDADQRTAQAGRVARRQRVAAAVVGREVAHEEEALRGTLVHGGQLLVRGLLQVDGAQVVFDGAVLRRALLEDLRDGAALQRERAQVEPALRPLFVQPLAQRVAAGHAAGAGHGDHGVGIGGGAGILGVEVEAVLACADRAHQPEAPCALGVQLGLEGIAAQAAGDGLPLVGIGGAARRVAHGQQADARAVAGHVGPLEDEAACALLIELGHQAIARVGLRHRLIGQPRVAVRGVGHIEVVLRAAPRHHGRQVGIAARALVVHGGQQRSTRGCGLGDVLPGDLGRGGAATAIATTAPSTVTPAAISATVHASTAPAISAASEDVAAATAASAGGQAGSQGKGRSAAGHGKSIHGNPWVAE